MHHIFVLLGKSASGKDTLYERLLSDDALALRPVVTCTTRPIRAGEQNGREYYFSTQAEFEAQKRAGKVIESRCYQTVYGPWYYYTADDGQIDLVRNDYLIIGTLESYVSLRDYYRGQQPSADSGEKISAAGSAVVPLYVTVEDGERLLRAIHREQQQAHPAYAELCRRFLADCEDFSEEKLHAAGITEHFDNADLDACERRIRERILELQEK